MIFEPNPETYRRDVSIRGMAVPVIIAGLSVAFALTPQGQRWLAVDPVALVGCFAGYVLVYGANVSLMTHGERLLKPQWWPMRVLGCIAAACLGCVFAAATPFDASAAWILLLVIALAIGVAVRPTHWMLGVFLGPPLAFRAGFVPEATPLSYAVLVIAAVAAHAVFYRTSFLMLRERTYGTQTQAAQSMAEEAETLSANLRAAMSLHDGLSGSLMALRHRLEHADTLADVEAMTRPWLLRARGLVYHASDGAALERTLQRLARSLGVALGLDLAIDEQQLAASERADLGWIASELVANAAAHAQRRALRLRIRAGQWGVSLESNAGSEQIGAGERGRGLRNIELRALLHGGNVTWNSDCFRVEWRHAVPLERLLLRSAAELFVVVGFFSVVLLYAERRAGPFFVVVVAVIFLVVAFWDRFVRVSRAERQLNAARERRFAAEEGELLHLAGTALEPGVREVEEALAAPDRQRLTTALTGLAEALRDIMWSLEWTGDLAMLRADIADRARQAGVAPPSVPAVAVDDPAERWRLVSAVRARSPIEAIDRRDGAA